MIIYTSAKKIMYSVGSSVRLPLNKIIRKVVDEFSRKVWKDRGQKEID